MNFNIKDIVKNNTVQFHHYRAGVLYYQVVIPDGMHFKGYIFPVPIYDIGEATFLYQDKAILFMRYIKKAIDEKTFIELQTN